MIIYAISEADHQHLNPASLVAKEAGLASVWCAGALGLCLASWTICQQQVVGAILGLVEAQLGGWLPVAVTPLLAVCHPERHNWNSIRPHDSAQTQGTCANTADILHATLARTCCMVQAHLVSYHRHPRAHL